MVAFRFNACLERAPGSIACCISIRAGHGRSVFEVPVDVNKAEVPLDLQDYGLEDQSLREPPCAIPEYRGSLCR